MSGTTQPSDGAAGVLRSVREGERRAADVVEEHLVRLHDVHRATNAVTWFDDDRVRGEAAALDDVFDRHGPVGPLHGLPVTVKDWIDAEGFPCSGGSPAHRDRRPWADATAVARLRAAGAVVLAKTSVWSDLDGRPVAHPADPARTAGGSSSGEAVAVASGASLLGLGSDSGGSIRLPAAYCGIYGFKPTAGRVPTTGHFPNAGDRRDGRTQIGPLAATLDDLALALSVIAGPDGLDAAAPPVPFDGRNRPSVEGVQFAVVDTAAFPPAEAVADAVERARRRLIAAGAIEVAGPPSRWLAEARDVSERYWTRSDLAGHEVVGMLGDWDTFRRRYLRLAAQVPLLVGPVTRDVAPMQRPLDGDDFIFTLPASLTGSPAVSVPMPRPTGLPVAVQIAGPPWQDHLVLAAARAVAAAPSAG